jgi:hypothetical protein
MCWQISGFIPWVSMCWLYHPFWNIHMRLNWNRTASPSLDKLTQVSKFFIDFCDLSEFLLDQSTANTDFGIQDAYNTKMHPPVSNVGNHEVSEAWHYQYRHFQSLTDGRYSCHGIAEFNGNTHCHAGEASFKGTLSKSCCLLSSPPC